MKTATNRNKYECGPDIQLIHKSGKKKRMNQEVVTLGKAAGDAAAYTVTLASIFTVLPNIIMVLTFVWLSMQIIGWLINRNWRRKP